MRSDKTTTGEIITKNPRNFFSVGLGNYQNYFIRLPNGRVNDPEFITPRALRLQTLFLAWLVNGGLIMLVASVWVLAAALWRTAFLPAEAALIALVGYELVDRPYYQNDPAVLF